jgi:hypothetical protein
LEKVKRKNIPKKLRFEVFKRDSFTCQYCGRKAPDVVLEIDHIKPVAEGGKNTILNLITSCQECNRGKGKQLLTEHQTLDKERNQLEVLQQRKEQMRMMMAWKDELLQIDKEQVEYIEKLVCDEDDCLTDAGRNNVRSIIQRFGFNVVIDCAIIAKRRYSDGEERMKKLGGIAWNITHKDDKK